MALSHNCDDARIEYIGNGSQVDYPFHLNTTNQTMLQLLLERRLSCLGTRYCWLGTCKRDTTIRFEEEPELDQKFIIYRCTT